VTMDSYPVTFSVDYPDRPLQRLSSALRIFWIIPIVVLLETIQGGSATFFHTQTSAGSTSSHSIATGGGILVLPVVLMLLCRRKYPGWWLSWNLELSRFSSRIFAYTALMDDRYPSTDEHQSVHLDYPEVTGQELSRWLPLVKWFLAIPHYFVLFFLGIASFFVLIYVWFAILFTGRYPRGAFGFIEGVMRWGNRVSGYAFTLVTDAYPPFRLSA
jgi:Domain of unknown function (DUF4389)